MRKYLLLCLVLGAGFLAGCANYNPLHQSVDEGFEVAASSFSACETPETAKTFDGGQYDPVNCRAEFLLAELNEADYPYIDLAETYATTLREVAQQVDCAEISPRQGQMAMDKAYSTWLKAEEYRCQIDTFALKKRQPLLLDVRPLFDRRNFACYSLITN